MCRESGDNVEIAAAPLIFSPGAGLMGTDAFHRRSTMKLGITSKAFIALLLVALVVLTAMGLAGRWSFSRGFIGYIDEVARQRIEEVAPRFSRAFAEHGSWDFLRGDRRVGVSPKQPHHLRYRRRPLNRPHLPPAAGAAGGRAARRGSDGGGERRRGAPAEVGRRLPLPPPRRLPRRMRQRQLPLQPLLLRPLQAMILA